MTLKPPDVRLARSGDEELLFALIRSSEDEATAARNYDKVRAVVGLAINRTGSALSRPSFGVVDGKLGIEAAIGLYPVELWDSDDRVLREFFLFVHPACRRSTHGKHLIQFAQWYGDQSGLPVLIECPLEQEAKTRLIGYRVRQTGALYRHDPVAA